MFHKLKSNDRVYWINLEHIAFIVENNQKIVLFLHQENTYILKIFQNTRNY